MIDEYLIVKRTPIITTHTKNTGIATAANNFVMSHSLLMILLYQSVDEIANIKALNKESFR